MKTHHAKISKKVGDLGQQRGSRQKLFIKFKHPEVIIVISFSFIHFHPFAYSNWFQIITETMEVKKTLEEVQIRHQELIKLEKSIMELKTLFVEMALLVEQQVNEAYWPLELNNLVEGTLLIFCRNFFTPRDVARAFR